VTEASSFPDLKRLLVRRPIPSHLAHHERLSRVTGLAVLSSDALSSDLLHNQRALLIKGALLFRPNTVVTSVPFHLAR
jgi:hypothetical protein